MPPLQGVNQRISPGVSSSGGFRERLAGVDYRQWVKALVYGLLLVNFVQYIGNDYTIAKHTVHDGWRLIDWTAAFATTLDESAWFVLLFMLELETYLLSDEAFLRRPVKLMQALRLICYLAIGHTVFAFSEALMDLGRAVEHSGLTLCSLATSFADQGLSFARNLYYVDLDGTNCRVLSNDTVFYQFAQNQALTDRAGMRVEWQLAWVDLLEGLTWLLILLIIELTLRLQEKGITSGSLRRFAKNSKAVLYGVLWCAAAYWAYRGHWMFAWDEALWILGFMAIGMNLADWRKDIEAAALVEPQSG